MQDFLSDNIDLSTNVSRLEKTSQSQDVTYSVLVKKQCEDFKEQYNDFHVNRKTQSTTNKSLVKYPIYEDISDDEMDDSDLKLNTMKAEIKELKKVIEIKEKDLVNVTLLNKYERLEDKVAQLEKETSKLSKMCEDYRKHADSNAKTELKTLYKR